jgi:hypothetical protein
MSAPITGNALAIEADLIEPNRKLRSSLHEAKQVGRNLVQLIVLTDSQGMCVPDEIVISPVCSPFANDISEIANNRIV